MKTNQEKLNADTIFAFRMALNGHKQFEYQLPDGDWIRNNSVSSNYPYRIYHEIPGGWTRHDGEDWKGDKDAKFEAVIFCDGRISHNKNTTAEFWSKRNSNFTGGPEGRIYAYKLAEQTPAIPEGFTKWDGGERPVAPETEVEYMMRDRSVSKDKAKSLRWNHNGTEWAGDIIAYRVIPKKVLPWTFGDAPLVAMMVRKSDGQKVRFASHFDGAAIHSSLYKPVLKISYETLAADYLQLNGEVCGTEDV
jgi:hypothetical protein